MADVNDRLVVELSANVSKLLDGLKKASDAGQAWGDGSAKQVQRVSAAFNGVQFEGATSRLKAEMLKQIELTHQLDIARTAGDTKTAAALQEQITLMQRIRQLRSAGFDQPTATKAAGEQVAALAAAAAQARSRREEEEKAEQAAQRRERVTGNPGMALQNVFSRSRLGVIEEGSAKIPIFGSALEELGAAGLVAAAGVFAASEAMEKAKEAAEYAEGLQNTASKLGITTKALQEYNYVALLSGISTDAMSEALKSGNEVLGAFQSNVGAGKIKPVFAALGITQEEAQKAGNISDLLPEIAEKIKALGSTAEQSKIAEKLGLSSILPVLQKGKEGIEELTGEAGKVGVVLDSALIAKGAAAAEEFKKASDIIDVDMKRAFIELAPVIAKVLALVVEIAKSTADTIDSLRGGGIESFNSAHVTDAKADVQRGMNFWTKASGGKVDQTGSLVGGRMFETMAFNGLKGQMDKLNTRSGVLSAQDAAADAALHHGAASQLVDDKDKKGRSADQTGDFDKSAADARDSAAKELASAQAALTKNIQDHADAEARAVDADTAKKITDLSAEEVKIRESKNDAHKASQLALIETAKADTLSAAAAKTELIARTAIQAQAQADLQDNARSVGLEDRRRTAQASLSPSAQVRTDAELQNFKDQQNTALEAEHAHINTRQQDDPSYTTGAADLSDFQSTQSAELVAKRDQVVRSANPLYAEANPTSSIGDDLVAEEAKGVASLADGLTSIITQTKSVKAAFTEMAQGIIADLVRIGIQQEVTQPLAKLLYGDQAGNLSSVGGSASVGLLGSLFGSGASTPSTADSSGLGSVASSFLAATANPLSFLSPVPGFATGTDDTPGGLTRYNEQGVEGYVPPGAQIIPNATLKALSQMTPGNIGAGGPMTVEHKISIDLTGANGDEAINRAAMAAAHQGAATAIATSRADVQRAQRSARQSLLGR
jgi:hypothetical protein